MDAAATVALEVTVLDSAVWEVEAATVAPAARPMTNFRTVPSDRSAPSEATDTRHASRSATFHRIRLHAPSLVRLPAGPDRFFGPSGFDAECAGLRPRAQCQFRPAGEGRGRRSAGRLHR